MRFTQGRRRQTPNVIIVSLIDVLLVVLIFLMVSTSFRQTPAIKIVLPESARAEKAGASPNRVVVTIAKTEPHLYLGTLPITFDRLQQELISLIAKNTNLGLTIATDEGAPAGQLLKVFDAATAAKFRNLQIATRKTTAP